MPWKHFFSRGLRLIHQGQTLLLVRKMANMFTTMIRSGWDPTRLLVWATTENKPLALVIDHDLGGGANQFRNIYLSELESKGFVSLLLSAHHGILAYQLSARRDRRIRTAHVEDLNILFEHLSQAGIQLIVFNNILSFPAPLVLVKELARWLAEKSLLNFFFLSMTSTASVRRGYCWTTRESIAASQTRQSVRIAFEQARYPSLSLPGMSAFLLEIVWRELLDCANEIRCFSEASRALCSEPIHT